MKYGLEQKTIFQIIEIFKRFPQIENAYLYGSRAKGNFKPASDIDITFEGEGLTTDILNNISWQLDDLLLPYTFDLSIVHHISQQDLIDHIKRVGLLLYSKDN